MSTFTIAPLITKPVISVSAPSAANITFHAGKAEMLKVTEDGFYVRGVKLKQTKKEAKEVYRAFKQFLVYHALTKEY